MLIEVSVVKNYSSSNLNRDSVGAPKQANFGGVTRARISSQCLKKNIREGEIFKGLLEKAPKSVRTRKIPDLVWPKLVELGVAAEYQGPVSKLLSTLGTSEKPKKEEKEKKAKTKKGEVVETVVETEVAQELVVGTQQIIAYSPAEVDVIARVIKEIIDETENVKNFTSKATNAVISKKLLALGQIGTSLDLALFGRMVAMKGLNNLEASMQVAHAISTHKVISESDTFTAVDDLLGAQETGAAMMGEVEFNSSCFYEYFCLDTDKLANNLALSDLTKEEVLSIVAPLIQAFVFTTPTGKQNTFAAHALPEVVLVEVKDVKIPVSYANAYAKPVSLYTQNGVLVTSVEQLADEVDLIDTTFALDVKKRFWLSARTEKSPVNCEKVANLKELLAGVVDAVGK